MESERMTQQSRAEATRRATIEAAAEVFAANGYANTNLADIISHPGISKGAVYFHFTSKETLARATIDEQHATSMAACRNLLDTALPPLESLISMSLLMVDQLLTSPLTRAGVRLTGEIGDARGTVTDPHREWVELVATIADRAIDAGDLLPDTDSEDFANFLVAAFDGVRMWSTHGNTTRDLPIRTEQLWTFVLPGIVDAPHVDYFREYVHRRWGHASLDTE
ncbi:TetR family transcriptional regulator [Rhodococcus wratislaviensis IFP 2016]|nr:TetR family transcriptional regulator [Rhodococcus wratislaviensis IFP 2016]NHU48481.1 TetR/AcrR family transcriptional regulator [Rhodococcus sp. A14]NKY76670.1 TetR/AcrR family transcriptional regulator [Rhodococcus opacus]CAG7628482.1 A-factor receptor protein [Rhodococcus opacus]